jgi:hypothetical protein
VNKAIKALFTYLEKGIKIENIEEVDKIIDKRFKPLLPEKK